MKKVGNRRVARKGSLSSTDFVPLCRWDSDLRTAWRKCICILCVQHASAHNCLPWASFSLHLMSYQCPPPVCCCCPSGWHCCRWSGGIRAPPPSLPPGSPSASAAWAPHFQQQNCGWTWTARGGRLPDRLWAGRCHPQCSPGGGC